MIDPRDVGISEGRATQRSASVSEVFVLKVGIGGWLAWETKILLALRLSHIREMIDLESGFSTSFLVQLSYLGASLLPVFLTHFELAGIDILLVVG